MYQTFRNSLGGESLVAIAGTPVEAIPQVYHSFVSEAYISYLNSPEKTLEALSKSVSFAPLRDWLDRLVNSECFGIIIHHCEIFGSVQHDVSAFCSSKSHESFFRLPVETYPVNLLPYPLNEIYRSTNGTIGSKDGFAASQFVPFAKLPLVVADAPPVSNGRLFGFFRYDTGDYLVASNKDAYLYSHDSKAFHYCGGLPDIVGRLLKP